MTIPTTTSDDSNFDSVGTSCNHDRLGESSDASTQYLNSSRSSSCRDANEKDEDKLNEGSTHTSAARSDESTSERFGTFDPTDALDSSGGSFEIVETDAPWKEPSDICIKITSEESADFDDGSTVISSSGRRQADAPKSDEPKSGAEDGDVLKPGERFGQFTVVRFVGGGGMGRVYEGVDNDLERKVAIKVLPRRRAKDEGVVARFLNEAKSAARLNHENIAQVYRSGNVDGVPYIAFEYVDGTNLRDYVRDRGVLELNEAIDFVLQAADALAHAALHGVTHRDVKPSNIIITPQKRAKLIDMGLARLLKNDADDDLTESGVTLGTFDYISPEQARDPRLADVRSDVYSLGCTFYYMLVGAPPFPEGTMLQKLLQHQGDEAPDVREANPKTPVEIASVIKKMMRKNPDERYQTPEALIADLREITELLGIRVSSADVAEKVKNVKTSSIRWKRFLPGLASAFLLLACVAVVRLTSNDKMELPDVDVSWNDPQTRQVAQNAPDAIEQNDKETNADPQVERRGKPASSESSPDGGASEKTTALESSLGVGKFGGAVELDELYLSVLKSSIADSDAFVDGAFSSESDSSAGTRRLAFCWNALEKGRSATTTLCANLAPEAESTVARSFALRTFGARDVKASTQDAQASANLFVVDGIGSAPNSFATLRAALEASSSQGSDATSRIELRFNGSIAVAPTTLVGRKIEICAGEGFRPSLSFQPSNSADAGGEERFLRLASSDAVIDGVFISFVVPKGVVGSKYAIFETSDSSNLTIRNSSLTFNGSFDDSSSSSLASSSSFFSLTDDKDVNSEQSSTVVDDPKKEIVATVRLENVFVRGEATLVDAKRSGARVEAENCLFNFTGSFFRYAASQYDASDKSSFSLSCDRILSTSGSYFVQIDAENEKNILPLFDVSVANSIIHMRSRPFTFVSSSSPLPEETFWSEWNFKGTTLLDATTFCRCKLARDGSIKDYPSPYEKSVCETISLNEEARAANKRWEGVGTSMRVPAEFVPSILTPLEESTDILPTTRENAKAANELVKSLIARFPDDLTKD